MLSTESSHKLMSCTIELLISRFITEVCCILKKERRSGFNGSFNSSLSYPLGGGVGANVNYRKNKINWFANYNIRYRSNPGFGKLYQEIYNPDATFISVQDRQMNRSGLSNTARGGMEYFFTDKNSITGSVQYRFGKSTFSIIRYCHTSSSVQLLIGKTLKCSPKCFFPLNIFHNSGR